MKPFGVQITNASINGFIHLEMFAVKRIMSSIIIIKYGIMQKPHALNKLGCQVRNKHLLGF